ncbi:helix-turn-helix transcriptional regulator [Tritonibacter mobilis]|uniref:helix-turn-helix transcriptional regulator n=1 Tax=Tritonibacter mobilis TaxID=379347 RepID=UPI001CD92600|nr:LuxR C-terminal-related transcriptional regulator [Tritonibacter mobilis]MCA2008638.1 LuxR C-terminal-related transcriptional regulator [Tritonibacter mobilis]
MSTLSPVFPSSEQVCPLKFTEKDISDLVGLTYQAALNGTAGWREFLAEFGKIGDGFKTFFLIQDTSSNAANGVLYDGFDPEWIEAFEAYYASTNPTPVDILGIGDIKTSSMMIERSEMEASEFYNDWLKPQEDLIGCAALTVNRSAGQVFVIGSSIRRRDIDEKEPATVKLLGLIKPHVLRVLEIQRTICEQRLLLSVAAHTPAETVGIFVTQGHHRLVYTNDVGASLLCEGRVVRMDEMGRFRFTDPADEQAHQAAIPAIVSDMVGEVKCFEASAGTDSELVYRCKVTPLQAFDVLPGALAAIRTGSAGLNVLTIEQIRMAETPVQTLASRFGLTRSEARAALRVANGETAKEISEAHSVSLATVRNQIKSAMFKVGVRRQVELALTVFKATNR